MAVPERHAKDLVCESITLPSQLQWRGLNQTRVKHVTGNYTGDRHISPKGDKVVRETKRLV